MSEIIIKNFEIVGKRLDICDQTLLPLYGKEQLGYSLKHLLLHSMQKILVGNDTRVTE